MFELTYTPVDEIEKIHAELNAGFRSGKLKSIAYRKYQLLQLAYLIQDNKQLFEDALSSDLGRPPLESHFLEINGTLAEAKTAYANVEKWAKPEKPPFSLTFSLMRPVIYKEPKGTVLVLSPFNYPVWLTLGPLAGAIAAGNTAVVKPSESAPALAALLAELVPKYLDSDLVRIVNGAIPETAKLLELPWGHILYTGGGTVGKIVASAAAQTLTPVSLELGGKCPVFIDPKGNLEMAANRILWGKVVNAGQTCVAPDYVLVPESFQDELVSALKATYEKFYPETALPNSTSKPTFSRLVNARSFKRVDALLKATNGTVVCGGDTNEASKYIAPTIVRDVKLDDSLMSEEIFGPVLPIVPVKDVDAAIAYVNAHEHPLALYVFSQDAEYKAKVFGSTQSGAAIANETVIHPGADGLPFGGTGGSGYGYHTGKYGFDMFTHLRASMDSRAWLDKILFFRYPPYTDKTLKAMYSTVKIKLPARPSGPPNAKPTGPRRWRWFLFGLAMAAVGALVRRRK